MKTIAAIGLLCVVHCSAGDFINLTFDAPNLQHLTPPTIPNGPYSGTTSDIIPGCTLFSGGTQIDTMNFNPRGSYVGSSPALLETPPQGPDPEFGSYLLFFPFFPRISISYTGTKGGNTSQCDPFVSIC